MTHSNTTGLKHIRGVGRRAVILGALALAACTQTLLEPETARNLTIRQVSVSTANLNRYSVRELDLTKEQFARDLRAAVQRQLAGRIRGSGNASLMISVDRVLLVSPGQAFLAGGTSFIDATVSVVSARDGSQIVPPTKFSGLQDQMRMGGIIGAMTAPDAETDYQTTLAGFAKMLEEALFEGGTTIY